MIVLPARSAAVATFGLHRDIEPSRGIRHYGNLPRRLVARAELKRNLIDASFMSLSALLWRGRPGPVSIRVFPAYSPPKFLKAQNFLREPEQDRILTSG